jgi:hypothetical protein
MDTNALLALRQQKDTFFKQHPQSPLTPEQQDKFAGLRYYPPNSELDLTVAVDVFDEQDEIVVETTTGDQRRYVRYGEFHFMVDGQEARLTIYEAPHGYFLPFVDASANRETYGAGRYLEPEELAGGRFHVDFNQAYNPYCAYNDGWNCPLTPFENRLSVAIRAGEMLPEIDRP